MTFKGVKGYVCKGLRTGFMCDKLWFSSNRFTISVIHNFWK